MDPETKALRRRDFWTAIGLLLVALLFLWKSSELPFFEVSGAGVTSGQWYNSAALVPFVVFGALGLLALGLLANAIRCGGAPAGLSLATLFVLAERCLFSRQAFVALILLAYIFALVPRVDFILASALVLSALIYACHLKRRWIVGLALVCVLLPSAYALIVNYPRAAWTGPHDDDWITLGAFAVLTLGLFLGARRSGLTLDRWVKLTPPVALLFPLLLTVTMAFGFRQNVPNRTGLLFQQIEYHYFVTLKPWLAGQS
ncbi:MAG: hypothetical protein Kilf2KO_13280 [Rhodospirillales bacterium]